MKFGDLVEAARLAGPGSRIEFRDRIAAFGPGAIDPMRAWLDDPGLGAFAVRVLLRIAGDPTDRRAVVAVFSGTDLSGVSPNVARDIRDALAALRPASAPRSASTTGASARERNRGREHQLSQERPWRNDSTRRCSTSIGSPETRPGTGRATSSGASATRVGLTEARDLLRKTGTSPGFERLKAERRLDLSMEAVVVRPEYASLFTPSEIELAHDRLADAGYGPGES